MTTVTDVMVDEQRAAPRSFPRIRFGRWVTHLSLLLIVVLWTLPTAGLFITSFRDPDQLALTGWWTALAPAEIQDDSRLPAASDQLEEAGVFIIRGNMLGEDTNREILAYGATNATVRGTPVGEPLAMPQGGEVRVQANGDYEWRSAVAFTHDNRPRLYYAAVMAPRATLENYETVLTSNNVGRSFINSLTVAIPATILPIMVAAFAAYALAWMKFRFREFIFAAVVGLLVVPLQMSLVPVLSLYNDIAGIFGLEGKGYFGVWLAHTAFGLPLAIYLLRNYMVGLPKEIMESARMDGASHFQIFTSMVLPLSFPALASIAIFQFLWIWNDLLVAIVFLGSQDTHVVLTGRLVDLLGTYGNEWHILTAGAFITIIVPLIVFFSLQRYFVRGLLAGSVK